MKKTIFALTTLLTTLQMGLNAFPFDETNYKKCYHRDVFYKAGNVNRHFSCDYTTKKGLTQLNYGLRDGITFYANYDENTKSQIYIFIDEDYKEGEKGRYFVIIYDQNGNKFITTDYTRRDVGKLIFYQFSFDETEAEMWVMCEDEKVYAFYMYQED